MDKAYDPKKYEEDIYSLWEKSDSFKPKGESKQKPFSIILPPPNANAPLHYGHAMYVVEDVLIRYHRMKGNPTLWLPGADHAGFETQVVYEKHLSKKGKSRFDYDRDVLYKDIYKFVEENRGTMENQLKKLGFSLDWSKMKFTLDEDIIKTVYRTFKKLFDDGLIYRDERLVNYCTKHGTAFSDLEVTHKEIKEPLYYLKYGPFTLATVRPETKFADTAVAVNPKDKRYKKWVGKEIEVEGLTGNFKLKVIADDYVDPEFGTGVVKITPYHDHNDFMVWQRHKKEMPKPLQVIDFEGKLTEVAGKYKGLKVAKAREEIVKDLKKKGLLEKIDNNYKHNVGVCYKCSNPLEPLPLPQWYIKTESLAKKAKDAVKNKNIQIIPKRFEKVYFHWMNNIRDWNISRQIVWGIRIPAFKCQKCDKWTVTEGEIPNACKHCKHEVLTQDTDTFDTWFSSGQWPFATLGYPDSADYKKFYPTTVMETGYDILFFWVARMIMLGLYVTNKVPFEKVYLHGMVRDSKGQKMSKSKGNVVDPLSIADKFGTDALRMSLVAGAGAGNDQNFSEAKVVGFRNFTNKIWNIGRYIQFVTEKQKLPDKKPKKLNPEDSIMIEKTEKLVKSVTSNINKFRFNITLEEIYEFSWHEFADIYIEKTKEKAKNNDSSTLYTTIFVYKTILRLLHPFAPFVTESIWQELKNIFKEKANLVVSPWPNI